MPEGVPALRATHKTLVMGILNVTPDSFCATGRLSSPAQAAAYARRLSDDGADMIDIGGESTRPGANPITPEVELQRVLPVLEALQPLGMRISIDTCRAETARRALRLGAKMVNDVTALRGDPDMASVIAEAGCECVLMHMLGEPQTMQDHPRYEDVVDDLCAFFDERISYATTQGIREEAIWLDPGFGFGKEPRHNIDILRRLREFKKFGRPVLIGTSNKSTIGRVLNLPPEERMEGTAATVAIAIWNGADGIRVHDVKAMARVARMCDAIVGHMDYE